MALIWWWPLGLHLPLETASNTQIDIFWMGNIMLIHWVTGSVAALLELAFFRCSSTLVGVSLHKVGTTQIFFFFFLLDSARALARRSARLWHYPHGITFSRSTLWHAYIYINTKIMNTAPSRTGRPTGTPCWWVTMCSLVASWHKLLVPGIDRRTWHTELSVEFDYIIH